MPLCQPFRQPLTFCLHAGVLFSGADDAAQVFVCQIFWGQVDKFHILLHFFSSPVSIPQYAFYDIYHRMSFLPCQSLRSSQLTATASLPPWAGHH